jgi:hypothetical protein
VNTALVEDNNEIQTNVYLSQSLFLVGDNLLNELMYLFVSAIYVSILSDIHWKKQTPASTIKLFTAVIYRFL